jgi:CRISPR-associated endonuclease Csn1
MIELNDGRIPDKIFVEVLRGRGSKDNQEKETKPRKEQLQELYNEVEKIKLKEWKDLTIVEKEKMTLVSDELIKQLHKKTNLDLQETRLFLYFKQCGKSAYTNKPINIDKLSSDYEIDHIIPKNKIKDNSFDNLVLVESRINKRKADNYPLNKTSAIWNKKDELKATWSQWKKYGLMTQKKYERLTREKELTDDEMRESVTNQLVFTGQAAILVANILKKRFAKEKVEIVYSKAKLVSEFRQKFDLLKCREINNQHHVHDAYLNIVVGNVYNERFTHDIDKWDNLNVNRYSQKNLFEYSIPYRNSNSYVWRVKDNKPKRSDFTGDDKQQLYQEKKNEWLQDSPSVKTVKAFVLKQNYKVTKKVAENGGAFYNENIIKSDYKQRDVRKGTIMKDTINQIPIKQHANDPKTHGTQKYGHYSEKQYAYCIIIEYTKRSSKQKKGERQKRFVPLSVFDKNRINKITEKRLKEEISLNNVENSALRSKEIEKEEIIKWLEESYSDPRIIRLKVYKDTLFELDGTPVRLSGFMEWQNAVQWYVDKEHTEYIRLFAKLDDFLKRGIIKIEKKKKNEGENNENADLKQKKSENTEKTEENEVIEQDELVNDERITLSKGKHEQILTRQKNLDLFVLIKKQLEKRIYKGNTALYRKITDKMQTEFEHLVVIDQIDILKDLIKGLQCNGARGNLKKILGPSSFGRYTKAPEIISKKLVLIEESYTGIKTKHTKIN